MSTPSNLQENTIPSILLHSPFTSNISNYYLPCTFKIPKHLPTFNGTTDPEDHLFKFECTMLVESLPELVWCKMFRITLIGNASRWFETLPHNSISTFSQLKKKSFLINFAFLINPTKYSLVCEMEQFDIKQGPDESLKVFVARFKERKIGIREQSDGFFIALFINGIRSGGFLNELRAEPPSTLEDLLKRADSFDRLQQFMAGMINGKRAYGQSDDGSSSSSYSDDDRECVLEFDGAVKGNPRSAGAGFMLRDVDRDLVYCGREGLGSVSKQVAEYKALMLGLLYAHERGFRHIRVRGDSIIVCNQVNAYWRVKSPDMSDLCNKVMDLEKEFLSFDISHVEKEHNAEADDQANKAVHLDYGQRVRFTRE